jgi:hypothetical protein
MISKIRQVLKILRLNGRAGSSPAAGTNIFFNNYNNYWPLYLVALFLKDGGYAKVAPKVAPLLFIFCSPAPDSRTYLLAFFSRAFMARVAVSARICFLVSPVFASIFSRAFMARLALAICRTDLV